MERKSNYKFGEQVIYKPRPYCVGVATIGVRRCVSCNKNMINGIVDVLDINVALSKVTLSC